MEDAELRDGHNGIRDTLDSGRLQGDVFHGGASSAAGSADELRGAVRYQPTIQVVGLC